MVFNHRDSHKYDQQHENSRQHNTHSHTHGAIDPAILSTQRGIWAIKWSFLGLLATALFQVLIVLLSGSMALLADTIHNFGDAATAIPLWIAFMFARLKPNKRFTYGYGRVEDLAGVVIVLTILFSAIVRIVWKSGKAVFTRLLDGVDPEVVDEIKHAVNHTPGVQNVSEVRVRWLGHRLHAEVNIAVNPELSVERGHEIAKEVRHQLLHYLRYLFNATIHIDPTNVSGEKYHCISEHAHDDFPVHSH